MTEQVDQLLKWGFSSMGAPEMNLDDLARLAARYECPHIELRTLSGSIDLPAVLKEDFETPEDARAPTRLRDVEIVCLNSSFKLSEAGSAEREALENFAVWADHLGARLIRVFGGGKWGDELKTSQWRTIRENIAWWRDAREKHGWQCDIILETHDAFSGSVPCLELFEQIAEPLPVIWDTHHTWKLAGESPRETWQRLGAHVKHVHLKDSVSKPSARHPYTYVHIGEGEFPWREVKDLLSANHFTGVVSIEWEKLWHPYLDPLKTALEKARERGLW